MAAPYVKRYGGGFLDLPAQTTPVDSAFLNAVEDALVRLLGVAPAVDTVGVWTPGGGNGALVYQKITNAQIDNAAAIAKSKLAALNIVDADVAGAAAIAKSKLAALNIVDADIAAGAAISLAKLANLVPAVTLPVTPVNGQTAIFTDSTTAPTYTWYFKYDTAISGANKWRFIGGSPITKNDGGGGTTASTTLVTVGIPPSFTIPQTGTYQVSFGGRIYLSSGLEENAQTILTRNGASSGWLLQQVAAIRGNSGAVYATSNHGMLDVIETFAAGDVLSIKNLSVTGNTVGCDSRFITVTPVAVA